jgi:hypothetical protein
MDKASTMRGLRNAGRSHIRIRALRGYASGRRDDGKIKLQEEDCFEHLVFPFSSLKKRKNLIAIFVVQSSMNFNASVYPNAVGKPGKDGITNTVRHQRSRPPEPGVGARWSSSSHMVSSSHWRFEEITEAESIT